MCGGRSTMKRIMRVLWIDDDPLRKEDAINYASMKDNLRIEFILADAFIEKGVRIKNSFRNLVQTTRNRPDLFFLDYRLDRNREGRIPRRGGSVASQIREEIPDIPIYGVSEDYEDQYVLKAFEKVYFDKLLTMRKFEENGSEILYHDALDFYKIRCVEPCLNNIYQLLEIPESSKKHFLRVLPEVFSDGISDINSGEKPKSNPISFGRWILRELLSSQGPLFDRLYIATHLGVTENGFGTIEREFKKSLYSGVFSKGEEDSRWWKSEVDIILLSNKRAKQHMNKAPWILAPKIFNIEERTKCIVCDGENPETVGININNPEIRKPVHYSCSIQHPKIKRKMFFEDIRAYPID